MSKQDEAKARELLSRGLTCAQIADRMSISAEEARKLVVKSWRRDKECQGKGDLL